MYREGVGQGGGNSGLGQPPAGPRGKKKKLGERKASGGSAGAGSEHYVGANQEAGSRRSAANSASPEALTNFRIAAEQQLGAQPQSGTAKKAKGVMGVGQKVLHARPPKGKGGAAVPNQEPRLTQAQQQATFGKRQYSQAPPVIPHIIPPDQ